MLSERILRKWRKVSLSLKEIVDNTGGDLVYIRTGDAKELSNASLKMTQELLDQHLLRRKEK